MRSTTNNIGQRQQISELDRTQLRDTLGLSRGGEGLCLQSLGLSRGGGTVLKVRWKIDWISRRHSLEKVGRFLVRVPARAAGISAVCNILAFQTAV